MSELRIAGARHWESGEALHIRIRDGRIAELSPAPLEGPEPVLDAAGHLVSAAFVEPHYHLDKVLVTEGALPGATFEEQVEAVARSKRGYTPEDVALRAETVARILAARGVCAIRSFADVDSHAGLRALQGLLLARERLRGLVDIQLVAFPQHGLLSDPGTEELLRRALRGGADLLGGHPQLDGAAGAAHVGRIFALAREAGCDLDFHVDENDDPASRWLDAVIAEAERTGFAGRLMMSHCASLAARPAAERAAVYARLRGLRATLCSSPTSGLLFRGHGQANPPRGIIPVAEALAAGVPVACAQEVYRSVFAPNLRWPDPVFTGQVMAYAAKLSDAAGLRQVWRMLTEHPAAALGLADHGLRPGARANLVLLAAGDLAEVFTRLAPTRIVIRDGRITARSRLEEWQA